VSAHDRGPLRARNGKQRRRQRADYALYEQMKLAWLAAHPSATAIEYELAIRKIADLCGV
jgi:hypothetical protein